MEPRSKFGRFVLSEVLVEAGLTLMTEAHSAADCSKPFRNLEFRNGLMVALTVLDAVG
jgi:hypothetical protein